MFRQKFTNTNEMLQCKRIYCAEFGGPKLGQLNTALNTAIHRIAETSEGMYRGPYTATASEFRARNSKEFVPSVGNPSLALLEFWIFGEFLCVATW
jgi:hypothetical protein